MKVIGEKPLMPFLAEVDPIKMGKVSHGVKGHKVIVVSGSGNLIIKRKVN